jgi:hypothetical protein
MAAGIEIATMTASSTRNPTYTIETTPGIRLTVMGTGTGMTGSGEYGSAIIATAITTAEAGMAVMFGRIAKDGSSRRSPAREGRGFCA